MGDALLSDRPQLRIRASRIRASRIRAPGIRARGIRWADAPALLALVALGGIVMAMSLMAIVFCFVGD